MMNNRRKAVIGYATYVVGTRIAKRVVRRKARDMVQAARETPKRRLRKRRMIPLVGAAAAIAGAAVFATRHRGTTGGA
jgi:hypothetical protein